MHENAVPEHGNAEAAPPAELPVRDLYPVAEAAARLGISERQAWYMIKDGQIPSVKQFGRRLVPADVIADLAARLAAEAVAS